MTVSLYRMFLIESVGYKLSLSYDEFTHILNDFSFTTIDTIKLTHT